MNLLTEMLASAREADMQREARARRQKSTFNICRRRLLGVLAIGPDCEPCST
ncbi:MAG: hypothetical protein M3406_17690 [Chloroflexota bacterium]|nr:hypothetical protein [Chloroflexota bacterium]